MSEPWVVPMLVSIFGCLITGYVAMIHSNIREMRDASKTAAIQFTEHIMDAGTHAAGFARLEQQVLNVLQTAKIAHQRLDRIEARAERI